MEHIGHWAFLWTNAYIVLLRMNQSKIGSMLELAVTQHAGACASQCAITAQSDLKLAHMDGLTICMWPSLSQLLVHISQGTKHHWSMKVWMFKLLNTEQEHWFLKTVSSQTNDRLNRATSKAILSLASLAGSSLANT